MPLNLGAFSASGSTVDVNVAGVLTIEHLNAPNANVTITTTDDVLDADELPSATQPDATANITARNLTIDVTTNRGTVGTASNPLEINTSGPNNGQLDINSSLGIWVAETDGDLRVGAVDSSAGSVTLWADGSILDLSLIHI